MGIGFSYFWYPFNQMSKMIKQLLLCCLLLPACIFAQDKKINNTTQLWSEIDLAGKFSKKLKWQCDFQYSRQSAYEKLAFLEYGEQLTIRPWIHYFPKPTVKLSAFAGIWYNYFIGDNVNQRAYPEYRTALQVQLFKVLNRNTFSFRFRTELREIKDKLQHFETVFRERTMFKFQHLITHNRYDKNSTYFIAQDEIFINDGSPVTGHHLFDQNRIFLGLGYNITNNIAVETGYFNQFIHHAKDDHFDSNHVLQLTLVVDNLTGGKL